MHSHLQELAKFEDLEDRVHMDVDSKNWFYKPYYV